MARTANQIFFIVFLPIAVALVAGALGMISLSMGNVVRGLAHLAFTAIVLHQVLALEPGSDVTGAHTSHPLAGFMLALLCILWPFVSVLYQGYFAQSESGSQFRVLITAVFAFNLLILYRYWTLRDVDPAPFVSRLCRLYTLFALVLVGFALYSYANGLTSYSRMGYPLAPGVFASHMVLAFAIALTYQRSNLLAFVFAVAIVLSGARLSTGLMVVLLLYLGLQDRRALAGRLLVAGLLVVAVGLIYLRDTALLYHLIAERQDITSGRLDIWESILIILKDRAIFLFGNGAPAMINIGVRDFGTHNSFFDTSLAYGVPYALLTHAAWFAFFLPRRPRQSLSGDEGARPGATRLYQLQMAAFISVLGHSFLTNTFWTNMGDPATFVACLILLIPAASPVTETAAPVPILAPPGSAPALANAGRAAPSESLG